MAYHLTAATHAALANSLRGKRAPLTTQQAAELKRVGLLVQTAGKLRLTSMGMWAARMVPATAMNLPFYTTTEAC